MTTSYLTSKDLAKRWNVTPFTIRYWRITGQGPVYLKINGRVVYRIEDIELFEKDKFRKHTSDLQTQS